MERESPKASRCSWIHFFASYSWVDFCVVCFLAVTDEILIAIIIGAIALCLLIIGCCILIYACSRKKKRRRVNSGERTMTWGYLCARRNDHCVIRRHKNHQGEAMSNRPSKPVPPCWQKQDTKNWITIKSKSIMRRGGSGQVWTFVFWFLG